LWSLQVIIVRTNWEWIRTVKGNWVIVWGFGSDINVVGKTLFVRRKGMSMAESYPLDSVSHLLIAGDNILHTSVLIKCSENKIPVSLFDIRGKPVSGNFEKKAYLTAAQKEIPAHSYALSMMKYALDSRLRFLHELSETTSNLYYQGEFDILTQTRDELEYLITIPELERAYALTRAMYYEILSRAFPKKLGYRSNNDKMRSPISLLFSIGTAMLTSRISVSCQGAGLNADVGAVQGGCIREILEPALVSVVDRAVLAAAKTENLSGIDCSRYSLPDEVRERFSHDIIARMEKANVDENVRCYAEAVRTRTVPGYHF